MTVVGINPNLKSVISSGRSGDPFGRPHRVMAFIDFCLAAACCRDCSLSRSAQFRLTSAAARPLVAGQVCGGCARAATWGAFPPGPQQTLGDWVSAGFVAAIGLSNGPAGSGGDSRRLGLCWRGASS